MKKIKQIFHFLVGIFFYFTNAFRCFFWALLNPKTLRHNNFKMLSELLCLILKVANTDRHVMTHIAYVHPEEGEKQIVSIWAGAGAGADPVKRISELLSEVNQLKIQLANTLNK